MAEAEATYSDTNNLMADHPTVITNLSEEASLSSHSGRDDSSVHFKHLFKRCTNMHKILIDARTM